MLTTAKNLVATYGIIVKSDTVLDQVIEELGLDMTYEQLADRVSVSAVDSTQVMQISVQDENPAEAKAIVGKIVEIAPDVIQEAVEAGSVKVISDARCGGCSGFAQQDHEHCHCRPAGSGGQRGLYFPEGNAEQYL